MTTNNISRVWWGEQRAFPGEGAHTAEGRSGAFRRRDCGECSASASGPPATDGAGNVYAQFTGGIGIWQSNMFGPNAPGRILSLPTICSRY